ncbi:MAG TPA: exopolysaccharide biosynthesis protein [Caulobacter sp.]|nr:exopolysaccharide biosynthesis protein [Caulobacter sp.]
MADQPQTLEDLLGELDEAARGNGARVSVEEVLEAVGRRSFGPLLLVAGLLGMTPVSAVPSAPSVIAVTVILIAGQLLIGRQAIWLPRVLLERSVKAATLRKAVKMARKPARLVDRVVKPRLPALTGPAADRAVAGVCVLIAAAVPPLEFLPFVAFVPSLAIAIFGLALVGRDGLLVLIALLVSAGALGFGAYRLFF